MLIRTVLAEKDDVNFPKINFLLRWSTHLLTLQILELIATNWCDITSHFDRWEHHSRETGPDDVKRTAFFKISNPKLGKIICSISGTKNCFASEQARRSFEKYGTRQRLELWKNVQFLHVWNW